METPARAIFWDFDGTLAYRPRMFSASMLMALDEHERGHGVQADDFSACLRGQFPWDRPDEPHVHLNTPEAWWEHACAIFARAFVMNGIATDTAAFYARETRKHLIAPQHYRVYDDTLDVLAHFAGCGYSQFIVSNHVPELPEIARHLGLMDHISSCLSSASVGYEKPHPAIYGLALDLAGRPEHVWMVGDNVNADIAGAEACGIMAVLVHKPASAPLLRYSPDLRGLLAMIK
jgi:putative hydrolase of the HAD superfamily